MYFVNVPDAVAGLVEVQDLLAKFCSFLRNVISRVLLRVALLLDDDFLSDAKSLEDLAELLPADVIF